MLPRRTAASTASGWPSSRGGWTASRRGCRTRCSGPARSGVINNGRDFSCCILTADARLVTVGESLPIHVMAGPDLMARSMLELHPRLARGDAFLHNSPYHGNSHPADHSILVPVIDDARDAPLHGAGQGAPGGLRQRAADDLHGDGARRLRGGRADLPGGPGAARLPRPRGHRPDVRDADPRARAVAGRLPRDGGRGAHRRARAPGAGRGGRLGGARRVRASSGSTTASGGWSRRSRGCRPAAWSASACTTRFPARPRAACPCARIVTIDGARVEVDLTDNLDCLPCGLNLSEATARTAAMIGVFNSIGASVPPNAGSFRRIAVRLRENCVGRHPAPSHELLGRDHQPRRPRDQRRAAGAGRARRRRRHGRARRDHVRERRRDLRTRCPARAARRSSTRSSSARPSAAPAPTADGWLTILTRHRRHVLWDSVEVDELQYPIAWTSAGWSPTAREPAAGAARPRSRSSSGPIGEPLDVIFAVDGRINGPVGVQGGLAGARARNYRLRATGEQLELGGLVSIRLERGETIVGVCCGGGGYGRPIDRDPPWSRATWPRAT